MKRKELGQQKRFGKFSGKPWFFASTLTLEWRGLQEGKSHASSGVGSEGGEQGTLLQPFGLLFFNHRPQCPHLWLDKCWFSGEGFIFMPLLLVFMFRPFLSFFKSILVC